MTLREYLDKKKKSLAIAIWIAFPSWLLLLVILENNAASFKIIGFIGVLIIGIIIVYAAYTLKCPRCKEDVNMLVMVNPWLFKVSKKILCCPYCGLKMDDEIEN